jgi:GH15 family glucan-1,4-alpha-glucosidase
MSELPLDIEDYALIGDCTTAALVGRNGSIDWLCWPRFDSNACFAALLGTSEHGRWRISPADPMARISRAYHEGTLVLETVFDTAEGRVALIDFMTIGSSGSSVIRVVKGLRGKVAMQLHVAFRFDYGTTVPWVTQLDDGSGLSAIAGPNQVVLRSPVALQGKNFATVAEFDVTEGQCVPFVLTHGLSHLPTPAAVDASAALQETESFWHGWSSRCSHAGPWRDAVKRSLLTLKALTYAETGGIVAAPTTSLPEQLGGKRNWDYRYCWLRDATFTLMVLMSAGYRDEARAWDNGSGAPWQEARISSRLCMACPANDSSSSGKCRGCPVTEVPRRCALATLLPLNCSSTCTASLSTPSAKDERLVLLPSGRAGHYSRSWSSISSRFGSSRMKESGK